MAKIIAAGGPEIKPIPAEKMAGIDGTGRTLLVRNHHQGAGYG